MVRRQRRHGATGTERQCVGGMCLGGLLSTATDGDERASDDDVVMT